MVFKDGAGWKMSEATRLGVCRRHWNCLVVPALPVPYLSVKW